jgi:hypothetical protein
VADFVDRVAPYDPAPGAPPAAVVVVRSAGAEATFPITAHVTDALCEALAGHRDRGDRGRCAGCGSPRLDENLHCGDCGRLHGILGEVIAHRARQAAAGDGSAGARGAGGW